MLALLLILLRVVGAMVLDIKLRFLVEQFRNMVGRISNMI